jgi:hypothetical protein
MKIIKQFQLHLRHTQNNFYYEVPAEGNKREEVKQKFNNVVISNNQLILQQQRN